MIQMEVEIVSKECIKPSSPTPDNLKTHKLSLLDQFTVPVYSPFVIFYGTSQLDPNLPKTNAPNRSVSLKQSLSETLTRFYPLAGRIKDFSSIDCNDQGAYFVEAKVNSPLCGFLTQPNPTSMNKLLPSDFNWYLSAPGDFVLIIQVTNFSCGGFSIGVLISHLTSDGNSVSYFLRDWALRCSNSNQRLEHPKFDAEIMFPQAIPFPMESSLMAFWSPFFRKGKAIARRFVFSSSNINILKEKTKSSTLENPTRVETVSALLCKSIMGAFKAKSQGTHKPTVVTQAVNMRRRANPPIPECLIGNFPWLATKLFENNDLELSDYVGHFREATSKIDDKFVKSLQGDKGLTKLGEVVKEMVNVGFNSSSEVDYIGFTSLCNFGAYDQLDFGWGQPLWGSYCTSEPKDDGNLINTVFLMDTRVGRGIEALVILDEKEMALLENDEELLSYASLDPSPLKIC